MDRYEAAREPTPEEWAIRSKFLELKKNVHLTAFAFGCERERVLQAVSRVRWYLNDCGWSEEYAKAKRVGLGDSDARMRADIVAAYNIRQQNA